MFFLCLTLHNRGEHAFILFLAALLNFAITLFKDPLNHYTASHILQALLPLPHYIFTRALTAHLLAVKPPLPSLNENQFVLEEGEKVLNLPKDTK